MSTGKSSYINLLCLYIILKPIYIMPSGLPQLADIVFLIGVVTYVLRNKVIFLIDRNILRHIKIMTILIIYQFVINVIWAFTLHSRSFLVRTSYYIFNFLIYLFAILIFQEEDSDKLNTRIAFSCLVSCVISFAGVLIFNGTAVRKTGFFNNPNQLGFYAVTMCAAAYYFAKNTNIRMWINVLCVILVIGSGSKASFVGIATMLVVSYALSENGDKTTLYRNLILFIVIVIGIYMVLYSDNELILSNTSISNLRYRMLHSEADDDLWLGRGYNRILETGIHFLWGMGESGFERFSSLKGVETHSTYATLIVSYGWIGFLGYVYIFLASFRPPHWLRKIAGFSGILLYMVSHNGIRNSLVWIILALLYVQNYKDEQNAYLNEIT